jgi:hypothetical protein
MLGRKGFKMQNEESILNRQDTSGLLLQEIMMTYKPTSPEFHEKIQGGVLL